MCKLMISVRGDLQIIKEREVRSVGKKITNCLHLENTNAGVPGAQQSCVGAQLALEEQTERAIEGTI